MEPSTSMEAADMDIQQAPGRDSHQIARTNQADAENIDPSTGQLSWQRSHMAVNDPGALLGSQKNPPQPSWAVPRKSREPLSDVTKLHVLQEQQVLSVASDQGQQQLLAHHPILEPPTSTAGPLMKGLTTSSAPKSARWLR